MSKKDSGGDRTRDLRIRSPTPKPLGRGTFPSKNIVQFISEFVSRFVFEFVRRFVVVTACIACLLSGIDNFSTLSRHQAKYSSKVMDM